MGSFGAVNNLITSLGFDRIPFLSSTTLFRPMLYITAIWKNSGWVAIIYLASIASIPAEQYEAAEIDGASRMQRIRYITLPSIKSTITIMFILNVGNIMTMGFDQVFNLQNPAVLEISEIMGTYIYRMTFAGPMDFGFSTAMGLFTSVINFIFLLATDRIVKMAGESGLF
jgi:putative aldouronate transport system permease protein